MMCKCAQNSNKGSRTNIWHHFVFIIVDLQHIQNANQKSFSCFETSGFGRMDVGNRILVIACRGVQFTKTYKKCLVAFSFNKSSLFL